MVISVMPMRWVSTECWLCRGILSTADCAWHRLAANNRLRTAANMRALFIRRFLLIYLGTFHPRGSQTGAATVSGHIDGRGWAWLAAWKGKGSYSFTAIASDFILR